ncbi:tyrosine-protein phosphatase [Alteromonas sp. LMIT006]|jgi:protein-tyrosine phosphatase|nr:tyrosine-protein phosphatase [Alteromonas sp. LMIT006]
MIHLAQLPQIKLYFDTLLNQQTPIILHCSAGQDRTGFISAMVLSVLGVERDITFEVLDAEYGSVAGYLKREVGLTDADIAKLRNIYTQ